MSGNVERVDADGAAIVMAGAPTIARAPPGAALAGADGASGSLPESKATTSNKRKTGKLTKTGVAEPKKKKQKTSAATSAGKAENTKERAKKQQRYNWTVEKENELLDALLELKSQGHVAANGALKKGKSSALGECVRYFIIRCLLLL